MKKQIYIQPSATCINILSSIICLSGNADGEGIGGGSGEVPDEGDAKDRNYDFWQEPEKSLW